MTRHPKKLILTATAILCTASLAIYTVSQAQPSWNPPAQKAPTKAKKAPAPAPLPKAPPAPPTPKAAAQPAPSSPQLVQMTPNPGLTGAELAAKIDNTISTLRITTCGPKIKQVIIALSANQPVNFFFEPMAVDANTATNVITMESSAGATDTRYTILHVHPTCQGTYEQTIYWNTTCQVTKTNFFPNFINDRMIQQNIQSYRVGNNLQLSLIPTPTGCISVKKEMFR
jgi:hypothetical protein